MNATVSLVSLISFVTLISCLSFPRHNNVGIERTNYVLSNGFNEMSKVKEDDERIPIPTMLPGTGGLLQPLNQLVVNSFNNLKNVMITGSGGNGIPILDPLVIPFSIPITFPNPLCGIGSWQLVLSKVIFKGLSTFTIKSLDVEIGSLSFDNYIANMSATCAYALNYYLTPFSPPIQICSGTAYASMVGANFNGSGEIFPTPDNWFNLATITMTFGFQNLDIRIYPNLPIPEPTVQHQIEDLVYDAVQNQKPNLANLTQMTYSKTVSLNLGSVPTLP